MKTKRERKNNTEFFCNKWITFSVFVDEIRDGTVKANSVIHGSQSGYGRNRRILKFWKQKN
jgi:hypothetical protein